MMKALRSRLWLLISAVCCFSCTNGMEPNASELFPIDRMLIFVRDWPNEYVEIDLKRNGSQSTFTIYRPPQPGQPRILLDSIGPAEGDPEEIVELLKNFNIWAMADSNAVGAACNTRGGGWNCNPTFNDYSLVIGVTRGGVTRGQRYTALRASTSNKTARALGDFIFAMARKRTGSARRPDL
jgi:hypothetical protein